MPKSRGRRKTKSSRRAPQQQHLRRRGELSSSAISYQRHRAKRRPAWHRPVGIAVVALGVLLIVLNYAEHMNLGWMPGGHREAYFALGIAIAAFGAWLLAAFDRPA
jgi:hypothetical protein